MSGNTKQTVLVELPLLITCWYAGFRRKTVSKAMISKSIIQADKLFCADD